MKVRTGVDRLAQGAGPELRGRRVALLGHPASVDSELRPTLEVLGDVGAEVVLLLGPEHGYGGEAQDMERVEAGAAQRQVRCVSLYGDRVDSLRPTSEMLADVELVVADLQDVGARYYTFAWTAAYCLEACAKVGIPLLVLDRPNPLTGCFLEGPGIEPAFRSFVGAHDVITRHGLTIGELLILYAKENGLKAALQVLPLEGYGRDQWFADTGLPWVLPSPNMPTLETAMVYPGLCLLEGTNVSEGRGTTRPFEIFGAPWLDGERLAQQLRAYSLPGCRFRPLHFKPLFHKYAGQRCGGLQIHVTDRRAFRPLLTGTALLRAIREIAGQHFAWRTEPYEFVHDRWAIDLLAGGPWLREGIDAGNSLENLCSGWPGAQRAFEQRRASVLLYE